MILDPPATETLALTHGAARCELLPQVGGSIGSWSVSGQQMLRTASESAIAARDPYATAGFPLVPYSNRIGLGSFEWHGHPITLARNFPPEPHAIHGVGFERVWQLQSRDRDSVLLRLTHRPDAGWPWAFEAHQRITLTDDLLILEFEAVNLEPQAVPLAFGFHPYFPRNGARLTFHARGVWLAGDDALPYELVEPAGPFDFSKGMSVENADIDHCFTGWNGVAIIAWPDKERALGITVSRELSSAVVYIRRDLDAFCFEPVAHVNDALNRRDPDSAMPVIAPGESFEASIRFRAIRR
ncbi:MAG TPA: aldose 1-epimerase [Steroidobacteraceae bacterium]|nr:aldose 1-epimerase [Steroidobacteraceae bacterium]